MALSLRELTIIGETSAWRLATPLVLPTLTRLTLSVFSYSPLADKLDTPFLRTLCLDYGNSFPRFRQSPTCLKNISVIAVDGFQTAELTVFLAETVGVTALFLDHFATTAEVLAALRIPKMEATPPLLPQLKSVRFESSTIRESCDDVIALVDSRPAIEELRVVGDLDRDWPEDERELEDWDRWRDFCGRVKVIHVLENDF